MTVKLETTTTSSSAVKALPPGHFLALPPTFSNDPRTSQSTASHAATEAPNVASLAAADFDVDVRTGFLPPGVNVARLPEPYDVWEEALDAASGENPGDGLRLGGGSREEAWRAAMDSMAVIPIDQLSTLPLLRRAHLVLAFLLHFYVHSAPPQTSARVIPPSISVPLLAISPLVGLPPVLTYADTVLWNVHAADPSKPTNMEHNPPTRTLASFTNTKSEAGFYLVSAECESAGASALALMRQCLDELFIADGLSLKRLTLYLKQLAVQIDRIGDIVLRMNTEVDPEEFFHLIRPWFRGGDADGPTSPGWIFAGVEDETILSQAENSIGGKSTGRKFSGPSAGQSSLVHAFDVFLTVDHAPREEEADEGKSPIMFNASPIRPDATATLSGHEGIVEATFLNRMIQYMPLAHRTFLLHLSDHPTPLRHVVLQRAETHPELAAAYDEALAALRRFRDKHMRIVSRYIVMQARRKPSERVQALLPREEVPNFDDDRLRGTGGTPLIRFLKRCRDNTSRAMVVSS